ncbi:MAG TPA: 2-dehydropantoate 2-reductase [Peptococcaceae bacterium]|nr:MAG: 2-dehydropantoate 2-reductase [Clostridia bacterium 41_269]HBT20810.1 2-dehydropantoate 2-reductase [Peptococcaceae bacterium]
MKIAVLGAGAIGSVFGGFLAKAGHDVTLLGRSWHMDAINSHGLRIEGIWGEHLITNLKTADRESMLQSGYELILITVKSYDTEKMASLSAELMDDQGIAVSLQNGLGNREILEKEIGRERCALGRVIFGAEITSPGRVRVTVCADDVVLGPIKGSYPEVSIKKIKSAAAAINESGIPCRYSDDVEKYIWAKVLYNCALNPLGALLGVDYGSLGDSPYTRKIMDEVIKEIFSVADALGVDLFWTRAEDYIKEFYDTLLPPTRDHRPSMLQDIERGRRTEIDYLNGKIVEYGIRTGVKTPFNRCIADLVRFLEMKNKKNK